MKVLNNPILYNAMCTIVYKPLYVLKLYVLYSLLVNVEK